MTEIKNIMKTKLKEKKQKTLFAKEHLWEMKVDFEINFGTALTETVLKGWGFFNLYSYWLKKSRDLEQNISKSKVFQAFNVFLNI